MGPLNTNKNTNPNMIMNTSIYNTNTNTIAGKEEDTVDSNHFEYQQSTMWSKGNWQKRLTLGQLSTMWFGKKKQEGNWYKSGKNVNIKHIFIPILNWFFPFNILVKWRIHEGKEMMETKNDEGEKVDH